MWQCDRLRAVRRLSSLSHSSRTELRAGTGRRCAELQTRKRSKIAGETPSRGGFCIKKDQYGTARRCAGRWKGGGVGWGRRRRRMEFLGGEFQTRKFLPAPGEKAALATSEGRAGVSSMSRVPCNTPHPRQRAGRHLATGQWCRSGESPSLTSNRG